MKYTKSVEDYLEAIFVLSQEKGYSRTKDIAKFLKVKLPSVTEAMKKLQEEGLIEHDPYGEIRLTEKGVSYGSSVWEKHKILFHFLKDYLKVDESTAFKEACLIEHSLSAQTIEKLKEFLETLEK